jgi:hypothetical protein
MITARTRPFETRKFRREIATGAAAARFWVNTPAAAAGESDTIRATSSFATFRIAA